MQMVMTSEETQIQLFANWPMSYSKRATKDNSKNPEYHVVCGPLHHRALVSAESAKPKPSFTLAKPLETLALPETGNS